MAGRLVEALRGIGAIHSAGQLLRMARYDLSVWSDDERDDGGAGERVARIDGHIDISGIGEAVVLAGADTLILTVEDGRRMAFQLTSSAGGVSAEGWLPRA